MGIRLPKTAKSFTETVEGSSQMLSFIDGQAISNKH